MSINILKKVTCFTNDFKGATAIEYALIAAFIALAIIAGLTLIGGDLGNTFNDVSNTL